jgi:hypothetical protein
MDNLIATEQGISMTHLLAKEVEGVISEFGLVRRTDGRLPEVGRRQRRQSRSKRH